MTRHTEAARIVWAATAIGERTGARVTTDQAERLYRTAANLTPEERAQKLEALRVLLANAQEAA